MFVRCCDKEIAAFRRQCERLLCYDWVQIPLVYTQVQRIIHYAHRLKVSEWLSRYGSHPPGHITSGNLASRLWRLISKGFTKIGLQLILHTSHITSSQSP